MTESAHYLKAPPVPDDYQFIVMRSADDKYVGNVHRIPKANTWVATVRGLPQFGSRQFGTAAEAAEALARASL